MPEGRFGVRFAGMQLPRPRDWLSFLFPGLPHSHAAAWAAVALAALLAGWFSPVSPFAMGRADVLYGQGDLEAAARAYGSIGRWQPLARVRVEANLRAATISAVDLDDPSQARTYLERVIATSSAAASVRADAWERLGHLLWHDASDPDAAADAFQMAYELDLVGPEATRRLVLAARARTESGDAKAALDAWERVARRVPSERALARVSQASLQLAGGDLEAALSSYEAAVASTTDPALLQVARLGMATCKERRGLVEAALVDVASADLPADVAAERQRRLEERAEAM